jgi:N-acylglucosamine-6-phosphate 2-epimerase
MEAGADLVATTLSGYTPHTLHREKPDLDLVLQIARRGIPVLAEGRYHSPEQARAALNNGAIAVVIGTMITMPDRITSYFVEALQC